MSKSKGALNFGETVKVFWSKWVPFVKPCKKFATNSTLTNCGSKDLRHANEKEAKQTSIQMSERCKTANIHKYSVLNWFLAASIFCK